MVATWFNNKVFVVNLKSYQCRKKDHRKFLEEKGYYLCLEREKKGSVHNLSKGSALRMKAKSVKSEDLSAVNQLLVDLGKELWSMVD